MRSLRFELSASAQLQEKVGSAFGHIAFQPKRDSGFDALRNLMRAVQQRSAPSAKDLWRLMRDAPYLVAAAYWRAVRKQLYWPTPSSYQLHVVAEQIPSSSNGITLSDRKDCFGSPLAAITWRVGQSDVETLQAYARRFDSFWERNGLTAAGDLSWSDSIASRSQDIFHPGGTTRVGTNSRDAVLNRDLQAFEIPNLWVASTSVFPSGASANPTLTLMLLVLRLAERLQTEFQRG
jgi:choline dehydrogenase-like flavoprotein